jgi:purine-nucleoside phosphorylase
MVSLVISRLAAVAVRAYHIRQPHKFIMMTALVLGSGLGPLADAVCVTREVPFAEAGLPVSTVPGHAGKFIFGTLDGAEVVLMKGRVHLYECHSPQTVTAGVRWLAEQGACSIILTNAAGTLNPDFPPGEWMMLGDHLNLTGTSPLEGARFQDLTETYDAAWRARFHEAAARLGMPLHEGVYAAMPGPQFETPAEIRMLSRLGADAVGMSTVHEAIQARALGMEVAGFSCLTNWAAGLSPSPLSHEEVTVAGRQAAGRMVDLLHLFSLGIYAKAIIIFCQWTLWWKRC